jgi:homoserine kinase type II
LEFHSQSGWCADARNQSQDFKPPAFYNQSFFEPHDTLSFMAVFTEVTPAQAQALLDELKLGQLQSLRGIEGGIENTNYFLTSSAGEHVLTLFERLGAQQLPFYLHLMQHLAERGVPVPAPVSNAKGEILFELAGKPCAVVSKLSGRSELNPTAAHCRAVGDMLARMHLAARDYPHEQVNLRGLPWWNETAPIVMPHLNLAQQQLLAQELALQNHTAQGAAYQALPRGAIHADLFRDNVMFVGLVDKAKQPDAVCLGGFFDFYFAGCDAWLFDLAVCLNDWCIDHPSGAHEPVRAQAMLQAYQAVRPLQAAERQLLHTLLRAAALRFWISRLWDFHLPREANMLKAHDPTHFERVLRGRVAAGANTGITGLFGL